MSSAGPVAARCLAKRRAVVATLVIGGLVASAAVNLWIERPDALPSIALGSHALLVAERAAAFFAIWLLGLVVVGQAVGGRLPTEISGRGIRYAHGQATQARADEADVGLADLRVEMAAVRQELAELQKLVLNRAEE
jgi:hypothetical protein